jgi:nicotinamidase/pyrazinamidase
MWTDHCLQDGDSTFPPSLIKEDNDLIVQKGANIYVDAYSAFMDNSGNMRTQLDAVLKADGIDTLYVAGIATDVCVRWTVADALAEGGYTVKVITDATAAVMGNQVNFDAAIDAMVEEGATSMTVADVLATECPQTTTDGQDTTEGQENKQDDNDDGDDDDDESVSAAAKALPAIALLSGAVALAH